MALPVILNLEDNDLVTDKPWSKRASVTPRRTYSAEASIVYKRKLHKWSLADLERVERSMGAEVYGASTETSAGQSIWLKLMAFIRTVSLKMLSKVLGGSIPDWALSPLYDLIHDLGTAVIDNSGMTGETRNAAVRALEDFVTAFMNGFMEGDQ